ncbi:MAG: alpha/beta hydrolase [Gammaproteobacteria bacterium]|nr:alpha/beta hydrolase [Gammaproteobacteria bacterium]
MQMKSIFFASVIALTACARLDANLYNNSTLTQYSLDNYQGKTDITVDSSYNIPSNLIIPLQDEIISNDGTSEQKVYSYFLGDRTQIGTPGYKVILYCHGNRDHMDFYWPRIKLLANVGDKNRYGVLAFDYRGFGMTGGEPSEEGLYVDTAAAINWLESEGLASSDFIIYGFSMGTAPAVELTANPRGNLVASKIILEAPFASAEVMVQDSTLLAIPDSMVTNLKIDNAEEIKKLTNVPLLWIHGTADDFLSIHTHGEIVYKNHPGVDGVNKHAVRVSGGGHTDIPVKLGSTPLVDYTVTLFDFIEG